MSERKTDEMGRYLAEGGGYLDEDGNHISGCCVYKDTLAMQHKDAFATFKKLFEKVKPARVVEVGTSHGGLTLNLRDTLNDLGLHNSPMKTFDVLKVDSHKKVQETPGIELIYDNIFSGSYLEIQRPELVVPFIESEGTSVVLCDGGAKRYEFQLLAPYLKSGDIIMAHDYSPSLEYFKAHIMNKTWDWLEIDDTHIDEVCQSQNLQPFMQEDFLPVVWVCRQKA
jgi:hypothetical protein|tara:strand:- start:1050 stop:1724 length:675 start_codon:yes stop_codon:yes gene_type:complete